MSVRVDDADHANVISGGNDQQGIDPPTKIEIGLTDKPAHLTGPLIDVFEVLGMLD